MLFICSIPFAIFVIISRFKRANESLLRVIVTGVVKAVSKTCPALRFRSLELKRQSLYKVVDILLTLINLTYFW